MVYERKYHYGAMTYRVPAETVGRTLEQIEARDGYISKEAFLEESRPVESPTHPLFEWNDSKAAEKYRLIQSKTIINNLRIEVVSDDAEPKVVKAFVNVADGKQHARAKYIRMEVAVSDDKSRGILYRNALAELGAFRRKYKELRGLEQIFDAIDAISAAPPQELGA